MPGRTAQLHVYRVDAESIATLGRLATGLFGWRNFRVLTVTTSAARVKSLVDACSKLERGRGLFLFADRSILETPCGIFSPVWQTATSGKTTSLLPEIDFLLRAERQKNSFSASTIEPLNNNDRPDIKTTQTGGRHQRQDRDFGT